MESDLTIREANLNDCHPICKFIELVDGDFFPLLSVRPGGIVDRVERSLAKSESNYLIVETGAPIPNTSNDDDGLILALLGYKIYWEGIHNAYISFIAVRPDHRNMGISSMLMRMIEDRMRLENIRHMYICTWSTNKPAVRFYEKFGYNVHHVIKDARGVGIDTVFYRKDLK
ncbi:MAG: GNAT family N-acetyltransferase [Methanosarcinaceae archaeon]|nr:GNAT family N-acetyltransferase [Methanosarcinaceae archaeon]